MKIPDPYKIVGISITLAMLGVLLAILTNYASAPVPKILEDNPGIIWISIIIIVIGITLLTRHQSKRRGPISKVAEIASNSIKITDTIDVFVTYSNHDQDWVHGELVTRLKSRGFIVRTDRDFQSGALSIDQMVDAVQNSRHVIAVLTPSFMQSKWTKFETAMAQTLDPDASFRKLIPVMRKICDLPLRLKILVYRDLREGNEFIEDEWERLVVDLIPSNNF